jgi:hypothetical protein
MNNQDKIKRIVIWGLKKKYHTHRHIHQAFYKNAKKLGYPTLWLEDEKKSQKYIQPGDLILTADPVGKMVPEKFKLEEYNIPIRDDIYYCLHNVKDIFKNELKKENYIHLQYYHNQVPLIPEIEEWNTVTFFDRNTKTLYEPWGTDLLPEEFKEPIYSKSKFIFWIGSIWNDSLNRGNINEIHELKLALKKHGLKFIHIRFIPDFLNTFFIRRSRIAPAIGGKSQTLVDYLPCRMFKNISYGQLGITNIGKFRDILGDSFIEGNTIEELITNSLSLSKKEYLDKIKIQQEKIKIYTYKAALQNILKAINI